MPKGNYGLVSAAQTASWLLSSLPHIRFGLMIGIGAGVPREGFDIRLGDIVVSQPTDTSPGVVQYDLGKVQKDGHFQRVGSLNRPPNFLLTGLGNLSASQILQGPETPQILAQALERHPNVKKEDADGHSYVHPGALNDRLFEASATHVPQTHGQVACTLCDTTKEVVRNPRPSSNPVVHYGTIASGNSVVQDGISRDIILRNLDANCICFEMEAAGLMNTFSCLVIRGICDYADNHKNDRWQKYAAITAAAFAKELLQTIDPVVVRGALEMDELINQRHRDWLHPIDASKTYNEALAHRQALTGQWFLESEAYSDWKDSGSSTLWLHGKSGSGKTTLASTVIENLKDRQFSSGVVLYFYFSFADSRQQSLDGAVRSLAYQLSCQNRTAQDDLRSLYDHHKKGLSQPRTDSICDTFNMMVEHTGDTCIVLDALDECKTRGDEKGLLSWLERLVLLPGNLHLFITSRPDHDIMDSLQQYVNQQVLLDNRLITDDIRTYVRAEVGKMKRWVSRLEVQNLIEEHLMKKADGV
ncbi:unnamed protein product [Colletotrichum noveboracense]|uniref:NACHT domain-containing protein n=1 Tax=Colletotrichum noveboracense TaxID=2664923 RepID=A0A9W4RRW5_9PEZI|nr:unnamed protein product [Colletotrichum noveboracense]